VDTGSRSNQVCADCVDLSAVENASKQKIEPRSDSIGTEKAPVLILTRLRFAIPRQGTGFHETFSFVPALFWLLWRN
jgi:hypothetical protein